MRLKITHKTTYSYDRAVQYALLQLRLTPRSCRGQTVLDWTSSITGGTVQVSYHDQFRNAVQLVQMDDGAETLEITSQGEIETENLNGVIGPGEGLAPLWLYRAPTPATTVGPMIRKLASGLKKEVEANPLGTVHKLSEAVAEAVTYTKGTTHAATTAEEAAQAGQGVCQDQAQVMIAAARHLGMPARYVSGYLLLDGTIDQEASHGWAEVWIAGLGWVGFDVANAVCPDDRYVRVALGRDYAEAAPVHGLRQGDAQEELCVSLQVQQ
ncbi:transglutaminase family protein [Pseudooceanicola sp. CBS1P-1]|uniref:Transglutaminase family protein n=1 Tax=Pseudooceanicola albus TaxID=2692189 RepID=A0A6L7G0F6_9RHOB|nr:MULTISPECIES: transglutaminase family protein [Pseudooceanicola]MBT9382632.1 transglutaminase family protein [Pseudooceanicola endophyticus]MXN17172.1 transglutaminase family protein [Pseudooceanicola albus]